jgi:putative FmdB family regulatory protein
MPLYQYRCEDCEKVFEEIQKFSDPPLTNCPECNGKLVKLISKSSFELRGKGWSKDGYSG